MNRILKANIRESFMAVIPITLIVLVLSFLLVPVEVGPMMMFSVGAIMLVAGMGLFQLGTEAAMRPFGESIAVKNKIQMAYFCCQRSFRHTHNRCRTRPAGTEQSGTRYSQCRSYLDGGHRSRYISGYCGNAYNF